MATDTIAHVKLSHVILPLKTEISDAKVFTGRQKPMTEVNFLFCELETTEGRTGLGFGYSKRAGGPAQFAHAKEIADNLLGEDPNDIDRLRVKLLWAGASVGRSGVAVQAIAAIDVALWDLKSKRSGLPLSKLIGPIAIRSAATTPPEDSSMPRSRPSSITPPSPKKRESAESRSRWDIPLSRSISNASPQ